MADFTFSTDVEWRPVPDFPGYAVSSLGEVRSLERHYMRHGRPVKVRARTMKTRTRYRGGRPVSVLVTLCRDGRARDFRVHRLVLTAFVGPCPEGMEGCHNDGNPLRNVLDNLRWDTPKANQADSVRHGTKHSPPHYLGEAHPLAKMTAEQARAIHAVKNWPVGTTTRLARELGVTTRMVYSVRKGETWAHVK